MSTATTMRFGIEEALQQLGIEDTNKGTSTGTDWFAGGDAIDSMDRWQELLRIAQTEQEISIVVRRDGKIRRFQTRTVPPRSRGENA